MRYAGLDPADVNDRALLDSCQMGILSGHGRRYSAYIFISLASTSSKDIRTLAASLPRKTARQQFAEARAFRFDPSFTTEFVSTSFSATALKKMGLTRRDIPTDISFRRGMKWSSERVLNDGPIASWEQFFQGDVDFVIVAASNQQAQLNSILKDVTDITKAADSAATISTVFGQDNRNFHRESLEPFGFADGISQPLFFKRDVDNYISQNPNLTYDPSFDPRLLVLVPYPAASKQFGSYLVVRKLEQDLDGFRSAVDTIASSLNVAPDLIAAEAIGRFRDGTSLLISGSTVGSPSPDNNFDYSIDSAGTRCPIHSHVRKMNQRTRDELDQYRVIARRGIPYSEEAEASTKRGLLFLCYQSDIGRQFEFLQSRWANDVQFPNRNTGLDPIIGRSRDAKNKEQRWIGDWSVGSQGLRRTIDNLTALKGGEYFFTPPISFFDELAGLQHVDI